MDRDNRDVELEKRLLDIYPEARGFIDTVQRSHGLHEVSNFR